MPTNWVVSAHAASYMQDLQAGSKSTVIQAVELVPLTPGVTFIHFTSEATPLSGGSGWSAYECLMKSPPDHQGLKRIQGYNKFDGVSLPNYQIWGDDWIDEHGQSASGFFIAGDTYHKDSRTWYLPAGQWYSLKQFIQDWVQKGDIIFWLCCRSWKTASGTAVSFPSPPPPRPPRPQVAQSVPTRVLSGLKPGSVHSAPLTNG